MGDGRERIKLEHDGGMTSANDPLAGTPYRATRLLGEGGTALVYEARPRAGGRRVAVKALKPSLAASDDAVERMRIEAEALHCLRHPNIVRVLDFGRTPRGYPYLVEERLYGRSLHKEILARGPLPVREAVDFVCQLLTGLEVVHRLGIVHRDLKLGNLFLVRDKRSGTRTLKMLDFGFAKVLRVECSRARPKPMAQSTGGNVFVGTPRFAAPEQVAEGYALGPATDLYTTGLVFYSLLAGREPFHAIARETEVLLAQIQEELGSPACHAIEPIVAELEQFLAKAVKKHPDDRFHSAGEMKRELEALAHRLSVQANEAAIQVMSDEVRPQPVEPPRAVVATDPCRTVRLDPAVLADLAEATTSRANSEDASAVAGDEFLGDAVADARPILPVPQRGSAEEHFGIVSNDDESASAKAGCGSSSGQRLSSAWAAGFGVVLALCLIWLVSHGMGVR